MTKANAKQRSKFIILKIKKQKTGIFLYIASVDLLNKRVGTTKTMSVRMSETSNLKLKSCVF